MTSDFRYTFSITHLDHPPGWVPFAPTAVNQTTPNALVLNGTDIDLPVWPTTLSWVLRVPPSYGTLSLSSSGSPVLGVNSNWTLGEGLWYLPSFADPTAYLRCGSDFVDSFEVQLFDGEQYDQPRGFHLQGMKCTYCVRPYVLDPRQVSGAKLGENKGRRGGG